MPLNLNEKGKVSENRSGGKTEEKREDFFSMTDPLYSFEQIILPERIKAELENIISFYKNEKKIFMEWGMNEVFPNRKNMIVNLYGESGTGKTMTAHALAGALGKRLVVIDYSSIESKYVGETSKNLVNAFEYAKENNAILFFDEADALLSKRVTDMSSSTDISVNQTKSVLLGLLNNYPGMVIFTTNFISNYDTAFMRRIQYHIKYELPDVEQRRVIWKKYIPAKLPTNIDVDSLAEKYDGVSGSDIASAVFKSVVRAAGNDELIVHKSYFSEEIEKIIASKQDNQGNVKVTTREVSEEYAIDQIERGNKK